MDVERDRAGESLKYKRVLMNEYIVKLNKTTSSLTLYKNKQMVYKVSL
jgi:hypothetical protein